MTLQYEDVYSLYYTMMTDPSFYKLPKDEAYSRMNNWIHQAISTPYIRKVFDTVSLNDETLHISFELKNSMNDTDSDTEFVMNILAQYMVIAWMTPQVDSAINIALVIGGKEEKRLQSNYATNIKRLESLNIQLRKTIRDYGYVNNTYVNET